MKDRKLKILLVEDDHNLSYVVKDNLELSGYSVTLCYDGKSGLKEFSSDAFDLCIFDIMLPIKDGFTMAEEIRKVDKKVPIIFLTAKALEEDRIKGFQIGADDYILKPFSTQELLLRIEAILRRSNLQPIIEEKEIYDIGKYLFDFKQLSLKTDKTEITLTKKEGEILKMLCQSKNEVVTRENILIKIWGNNDYFLGRSLDVFITKLRKYLKNDPTVSIVNIHGHGFKLVCS
jgi:DNA-binding response OmpR family regulator